jgi:hypothetical protein
MQTPDNAWPSIGTTIARGSTKLRKGDVSWHLLNDFPFAKIRRVPTDLPRIYIPVRPDPTGSQELPACIHRIGENLRNAVESCIAEPIPSSTRQPLPADGYADATH